MGIGSQNYIDLKLGQKSFFCLVTSLVVYLDDVRGFCFANFNLLLLQRRNVPEPEIRTQIDFNDVTSYVLLHCLSNLEKWFIQLQNMLAYSKKSNTEFRACSRFI